VTRVAGGQFHSIALRADGTVLAWGAGYSGQLGDGKNVNNRPTAQLVPGLTGVTAIAAGGAHSLAITSSGAVFGWGDNYAGQLGDGTTTQRFTPVRIAGLGAAVSASGGADFSTVLLRDGTVWSFGNNSRGQLGDGTKTTRTRPAQVLGLTGAGAVAAGNMHAIATVGGTVRSWGEGSSGQLGNGGQKASPTAVVVTEISTAALPS